MNLDEKIKALWNNNKILFFLLLIPIGMWLARNFIIDLLVDSGNKVVGDATEKSNQLKSEQDVANAKADQIKDADSAAESDKSKPVGEDWHKK